uniref:PCI domain-containing protein n=1 Tax=Parascaris equorum TaxID=6256 RepID=A0A914S7V7_PAREQ
MQLDYTAAAAVRLGDLLKFNAVLEKHAEKVFVPDETLPLIVRLRQNVIKTALRQISTAETKDDGEGDGVYSIVFR